MGEESKEFSVDELVAEIDGFFNEYKDKTFLWDVARQGFG